MSAAIDSVVANGSLAVELTRVAADVRLEMTNGRLSLELPAQSKAQLSARVVNGVLEVSGLPIEEPTGRRIRNVEATLNGGGPSIDLRATNGRLTIQGK
jgi:HSP20 family molecular chaperone IbpA